MAGIKGKSGRKTRYQEVQEGKLEKICTDWLVNNFDSFDQKTKLKVCLTIAPKMVTQKKEVKSHKSHDPEEIRKIAQEEIDKATVKEVINEG